MLEIKEIWKTFNAGTVNEKQALRGVSLTLNDGDFCTVIGGNGAGKSTTIRLLMGALRPDSGRCTVLGADSAAPEFLSLKEDIGVVLDEAYFPESLNALQVGGVMAKTYRRWDGKQYQNYLTRFGLPEKKPFKDFSRGMKMKLAIAVALGFTPLYFSIPVVILAAFFLLRLATNPRWNSDAAIAVMSASALAVGIIVISRTSGMTTDVDNYMFGSVTALVGAYVPVYIALAAAVLILYLLFYNKLFAVTFDEDFARASGARTGRYKMLLASLTAVTVVVGMKMIGTMLITALIVLPPLSAMRLFSSFRSTVVASGVISVVCCVLGIAFSYMFSAPCGASIVCVNIFVLLASSVFGKLRIKK